MDRASACDLHGPPGLSRKGKSCPARIPARRKCAVLLACYFAAAYIRSVSYNHRIPLLFYPQLANPGNWSSVDEVDRTSVVGRNISTTREGEDEEPASSRLGCFVLLAPQKFRKYDDRIYRSCLLMHAVRSIDRYFNAHYGPYPIYVVVATDYEKDPLKLDGEYTAYDRALIQSFVSHSTVIFQEVNLYSEDALEPDTDVELILKWRNDPGGFDGSVPGRDLGYTSMSRLWSGRLQQMPFLQKYKYYMRMDDDSLLVDPIPEDPFLKMEREQLEYIYRREMTDQWGIDKLWEISKPYVNVTPDTPFLTNGEYSPGGRQPYNNFHIATVAFWSSPKWMPVWNALNEQHAFFKYRNGDANVHAIAVMLMTPGKHLQWTSFPYRHNSNDMPGYPPYEAMGAACESAKVELNATFRNGTSRTLP
jgi:hypothetical protein